MNWLHQNSRMSVVCVVRRVVRVMSLRRRLKVGGLLVGCTNTLFDRFEGAIRFNRSNSGASRPDQAFRSILGPSSINNTSQSSAPQNSSGLGHSGPLAAKQDLSMVVLHLKSGGPPQQEEDGGDAFLYETSCATPVDALISDLVRRVCPFPSRVGLDGQGQ